MMEKQKSIPKLRFPEFAGEWEKKKLGEVAEVSSGGTPSRTNSNFWNGDIPWVSTTLIDFNTIFETEECITREGLKNSSAKVFPVGTLLMAMYGQGKTRGKISLLGINASTNQACGAIMPNNSILINTFLFQNLAKRYDEIRDLSNQGGQENLSGGIIKGIEISFPSLPEQTKIATFLTTVDSKLQALKKKKSLLEAYKKGVMQKLFCLNYDSSDLYDEYDLKNEKSGQSQKSNKSQFRQLRFKDENGNEFPDWEERKLSEVADRITIKNKENNTNVLTISAQYGLISQLEYFSKSVSAKDLTGYYLLSKGDFAYNKSYSTGYPMGTLKRLNRYPKGVVSTLYICFRFKFGINLNFMEHYFETGLLNIELEKVAQEGARNHGLLNIGVIDFFNIELNLPTLPEQTRIANFLSSIDEKINYCQKQIEKTELWKKGLLQKLFI